MEDELEDFEAREQEVDTLLDVKSGMLGHQVKPDAEEETNEAPHGSEDEVSWRDGVQHETVILIVMLDCGLVGGLHLTRVCVEAIGCEVKGARQSDLTDDLWLVIGYIYVADLEL